MTCFKVLPAPKWLEEVLHITNQEGKKQQSQSYDAHCEKNFPYKITWNLIPSKCTNLLQNTNKRQNLTLTHILKSNFTHIITEITKKGSFTIWRKGQKLWYQAKGKIVVFNSSTETRNSQFVNNNSLFFTNICYQ